MDDYVTKILDFLLQPAGGYKIFISIKANLIKKFISFNGSYAKIICIPTQNVSCTANHIIYFQTK